MNNEEAIVFFDELHKLWRKRTLLDLLNLLDILDNYEYEGKKIDELKEIYWNNCSYNNYLHWEISHQIEILELSFIKKEILEYNVIHIHSLLYNICWKYVAQYDFVNYFKFIDFFPEIVREDFKERYNELKTVYSEKRYSDIDLYLECVLFLKHTSPVYY